MKKQLIVTIGREFGSGGRDVALLLGKRLGLPVYDKEFFAKELERENIIGDSDDFLDEQPITPFTLIPVTDYTYWVMQSQVANAEFDFIKKKAYDGESFIVVGRCAEHVLKGNAAKLSFFVTGEKEAKIKRVMEINDMSEKDAASAIKSQDKMRKSYHNFYCTEKWGDSRAYDMCVSSSKLGIEGTADVIEKYIDTVRGAEDNE